MSPVAGVPPATSPVPAQATPTLIQRSSNPAPYGWQILTVRTGDTLSDIATTHLTTVGVLFTRNRFVGDGGFLAVGRQLWVPPARNQPHIVPPRKPTQVQGRPPMWFAPATPSAASQSATR